MENSLTKSLEELKEKLKLLDWEILQVALEKAKEKLKAILEGIDILLMKHRDKALSLEHIRPIWYTTCLGAVRIGRRYYWDTEKKEYRCLLDEFLGMEKGEHSTPKVKEMVLALICNMPFRKSVEVLETLTPIKLSHQSAWNLLRKLAEPYLEEGDQEIKQFLETGEIPEGERKQIARLLVEADGVMVSLQREKARKAEIKTGIVYEGWEQVSKERYRTVNKTIFGDVAESKEFWSGMSLKVHGRYDLSSAEEIIVGGDGGEWVKEGLDYLGTRFQLDRYHLNRELCSALGPDKGTTKLVREACDCGEVEAACRLLAEAQKKARGEQVKKLEKVRYYLRRNDSGLKDYRLDLGEKGKDLRRTGAMEGNIDKLVVRRMKNQGMSWTIRGCRRLLWIRFIYLEGKLKNWLWKRLNKITPPPIAAKKARRIIDKIVEENPTDWLKVNLPALYGPHSGRPWVMALKSLTEVKL